MTKHATPGNDPAMGRAGRARPKGFADAFDPRNKPSPNSDQIPPAPALWSEALCAAGKCVVAVFAGFKPTRIELRPSRNGRWAHEITGFATPLGSPIGFAIHMAGTTARHLSDFDEPDVVAAVESAIATGIVGDPFLCSELRLIMEDLIEHYTAIVRAIASRLVSTLVLSGEELAAHLAPILASRGE
jgi:hypothetical protein